MPWRRLNLALIDEALSQLAAMDPGQSSATGNEEPPTDDVLQCMASGYAYVDQLLGERREIFRYGESSHLLELNHRVLCGVNSQRRDEFKDHIAETERWFYERPGAGIDSVFEWYQRNHTRSPQPLAAGIFVQTTSSPQLFIEGNRRTATLLASYVLARGGLPPLVVGESTYARYCEIGWRCTAIARSGVVGIFAVSLATRWLMAFIRDTGDTRYLSEPLKSEEKL